MKQQLSSIKEKASGFAIMALKNVPEVTKATWKLRAFALLKIPMIAFLGPRVTEINSGRISITIPLGYRSRNHLKSMYFGALAAGADLAIGLLAMKNIEESGEKIQLIFKDFSAEYLKRAESDVQFICEDGEKITALVQRACASEDRVQETFHAYALTPATLGTEPVAKFALTLSLKKKN